MRAGTAEGVSELLSLAAPAPKVAVEGQPKPDESEDAIAPGERGNRTAVLHFRLRTDSEEYG